MTQLTNDDLIKLRSRLYRGYRAPVATTDFFDRDRVLSVTRNADEQVTQLVKSTTYEDGTVVTETTDFTLDAEGNVQSSVVSYNYDK